MVFQHYHTEYDVPVAVELKAMVLGRLDVSSVRVRLSPKTIRYVCIYSLASHAIHLGIVHSTLIRFRYLERLLRLTG